MAWTYSDYVTFDYGATRLARFRLHMQEVSDKLTAEMTQDGLGLHSSYALNVHLGRLQKQEPDEVSKAKLADSPGTHSPFVRARPLEP